MERALPKAAQGLLDMATAAGWLTRVTWQEDSAGHPFVTLELARDLPRYEVRVCWHSRATGGTSLRLSSAIWRWVQAGHLDVRNNSQGWRDVTLKLLKATIPTLPVGPQDPYREVPANQLAVGARLWDWQGNHGEFLGLEPLPGTFPANRWGAGEDRACYLTWRDQARGISCKHFLDRPDVPVKVVA